MAAGEEYSCDDLRVRGYPTILPADRPGRANMNEITRVLNATAGDNPRAAAELLPLVYTELRQLAAHKMANEAPGHTLQATALVHEAWLRLVPAGHQSFQNRGHFFAAAAESMRRILIEHARKKSRLKRGGDQTRLNLEDLDLATAPPDDKLLLVNEALRQFEVESPEKARIVVLKFFGGLTNQQVADILHVTERTVERQWAFAKVWLFQKIRQELANQSGNP
jgi:RNA polymerase sigma factor (TIGR02999 family)